MCARLQSQRCTRTKLPSSTYHSHARVCSVQLQARLIELSSPHCGQRAAAAGVRVCSICASTDHITPDITFETRRPRCNRKLLNTYKASHIHIHKHTRPRAHTPRNDTVPAAHATPAPETLFAAAAPSCRSPERCGDQTPLAGDQRRIAPCFPHPLSRVPAHRTRFLRVEFEHGQS